MQSLVYGIKDDPVFLRGMRFVSAAEGILSNNKNDKGGLTKYGISSKAYPDINIAALTKDEALAIYYRDYWVKNKCGYLPEQVAICVFDAGVNCGVSRAAKWLQRACRLQGRQLTVDGSIGPITLKEVAECDPWKLYNSITAQRLQHYSDICASDFSQNTFLRGWVTRVSALNTFVSA